MSDSDDETGEESEVATINSEESSGLLPFNPHTTGPVDLLRAGIGSVIGFVRRRERELIASVLVLVIAQAVIYIRTGWVVSLPRIPSWILIGIGVFVFLLPFAAPTGWVLEKWFGSSDSIAVSVQDPLSGDQRIRYITPAMFEELDIYSSDPRETADPDVVGRDYLVRVAINGATAYELERLDEEEGVAVASSMAGRSNSDIRRDRHEIGAIKTELVREADKAIEFLVRAPNILRHQGEEIGNELIRVYSDVVNPGGGELHDRLREARERSDPSDDLLGNPYEKGGGKAGPREGSSESVESGSGSDDGSDGDLRLTIHERAERSENGQAATDGGTDEQ
jgi:hypothetical protein